MSVNDRCGARASRRTIVKAGAGMTLAASLFGVDRLRTAARQDETFRIVFIQGVIGDNFYITMDCGARAKAEALGNIEIETQGPERWGQELQTPILNAVVQTQPDAIMMAPNDTTAMIAPIQAAIDAGVPVLLVDTTIDSDIQLADVSTDNVEAGRVAARGLAEAIGEQGKVFIVNTIPGISTTDQRSQGFREEIANYPDIEFVGEEFSNNDANQAAAIVSARLQSDPDLAGIFGTNLFSAQGAAAGVREQGRAGQVKVVSFDAGPTQVQDLRGGAADLLIAQHPGDIGEIAVQLLHDFLTTGNPPEPKKYVTGATVITQENIEDPEASRYLYVADCSTYTLTDITPQDAAASEAATPEAGMATPTA